MELPKKQHLIRDWLNGPMLEMLPAEGFHHKETAAQACITIQTTLPVTPALIVENGEYRIAVCGGTSKQRDRILDIVASMLRVDRRLKRANE